VSGVRLFGALAVLFLLISGGAVLFVTSYGEEDVASDGEPLAVVKVPELTPVLREGQDLFAENCAACHGDNASGRNGYGPPLVHKIYEPGHHADGAFFLAAARGVRAHHWPFGDMPPVENVTGPDVEKIVAYLRTLQRANGIY